VSTFWGFLDVLLTVQYDINFIPVTNLIHRFLYSYIVTILYMFQAVLCSCSGGQILCIQHMVSSLWKQVSGHLSLTHFQIDDAIFCTHTIWPPEDEHNTARNSRGL
jgi:hypothetical protein